MTVRNPIVRVIACLVPVLVLSGCWTVRETDHPEVPVGTIPAGKDLKIQLVGFDAKVTIYDAVYGYGTVSSFGGAYCHGHRGRGYHGYGMTTYSTTGYVPRTESTSVYRDRATDALEHAGCIVQTTDPKYRVEVRFDGPFEESGDGWATAGWLICSIFTADFGAQNWTAKLKIHDLASGRLIHEQELSVRDEAVVWGPIPIFSPSCASRTSGSVLKDNCLRALTDMAVAEAVAFLAGR